MFKVAESAAVLSLLVMYDLTQGDTCDLFLLRHYEMNPSGSSLSIPSRFSLGTTLPN